MRITVRRTLAVAAMLIGLGTTASAQVRVEKNVVYGMYSGAAQGITAGAHVCPLARAGSSRCCSGRASPMSRLEKSIVRIRGA
jgi:hypothetical protein